MNPLKQQSVLAFAPAHNIAGKKDATGAFQPEAQRFVKLAHQGSELVLIDNQLAYPARRRRVLEAMRARKGAGFTSVAFFCHGFRTGIQLGFRMLSVTALAKHISDLTGRTDAVVVPLYCCSTGADAEGEPLGAPGTGENSFADKLRDALCVQGAVHCRVMAHTTVAHTTKNPMVVFMDGMGTTQGGAGGYAPVSPGSANWSVWKRSLREQSATLRMRMPYLSVEAIHAELSARG